MKLEKYSFGVGDRFGVQGKAQLKAIMKANDEGIPIVPVWNKSYREHSIIGTNPPDVRVEADAAVADLGWQNGYYVDADHIGMDNVDLFMEASDFFTIDVADFIGQKADDDAIKAFVNRHAEYASRLDVPGMDAVDIAPGQVEAIAEKFLLAINEAGKLYRHIEAAKGADNVIAEISMDETDLPQTPVEMFFILAAIADEGIPVQTIAPRFQGRFNKSIDYVGDVDAFTVDFDKHLAVIDYAVKQFGLPDNLKLSLHSGSDKFAIYKAMGQAIKKYDAGLHVKTAGTTWLEELIGLACAEGEGLAVAKEVYRQAYTRLDELTTPYASVIDVDTALLPDPDDLDTWTGTQYASALRHDQSCPDYNPSLRQLLHVGYKVAAEMGERYHTALKDFEETVSANVYENLLERHIRPVFSNI